MINSKKLTKIWQQVPPDYYQKGINTNIFQRFWHNQKLATFTQLVGNKKYKTILDVGCAGGYMTNEITKILPESKIVGIDAYPTAIAYGKKQYPRIKFTVADAHKLPFPRNSFDLVICYETIEHLVNPLKALREIKRVLAKEGIAIVVMDSGILLFRVVWWFWEKTKGKIWQGAHLHPFHHKELEKTILRAGLKITKKHFSHFGMEVSFVLKK